MKVEITDEMVIIAGLALLRTMRLEAALEAVAPIIADQALERALEANRLARQKVIYSGQVDFVRGVSAGHDRADAAIRALKEPTP